jgi:chloride channel 7
MSLTVIMVELTNDVRFLLPIMTTVLIAKTVADSATHSIYHALLEVKCIPYLPDQARFKDSLELYNVSNIMTKNVKCIQLKCTGADLARLLSTASHNAFPVVDRVQRRTMDGQIENVDEFVGMVMRAHLERIVVAVLAYVLRRFLYSS